MMKNSIKKLVALALALMLVIPVSTALASAAETTEPPTYTANKDWGPNEEGIYEISTPEDLLAFSAMRGTEEFGSYSGKTVVLTNDIDLNPGWDASSGTAPTNVWTPLVWFYGTFDGQGYTISGLYCKTGNTAGFISNAAASKIKNLTVKNSYFEGKSQAGFVATVKGWSTFENMYIDAIVKSNESCAGGFAGTYLGRAGTSETSSVLTPAAKFTNCVFTGSVSAKTYAGGILGSNDKIVYGPEVSGKEYGYGNYAATLIDCVNYGTVESLTGAKTAGLIGVCANATTLTRCYSAGFADTALINAQKSTLDTVAKPDSDPLSPAAIIISDCYYLDGTAYTTADNAPTITLAYSDMEEGETVSAIRTASASQLVSAHGFEKTDEKDGWAVNANGSKAMTKTLLCQSEGHSHKEEKFEASCVAEGYSAYVCENCGFSYSFDKVAKLDHIPSGEWIVDKEPTLLSFGGKHMNCTECEQAIWMETIPKLDPSELPDEDENENENNGEPEPEPETGDVPAEEEPSWFMKIINSIVDFFKGIFEAIFGKKE